MNTKQLIIGLLIFAAVVAVFIWLYNRNAKKADQTTATTNEIVTRAMVSQFSQATGKCYCGTSNTPVDGVLSQNECANKCGSGNYRFVPNLTGTARAIR